MTHDLSMYSPYAEVSIRIMGKVGKREEIEQWLKLIGSTYMTE